MGEVVLQTAFSSLLLSGGRSHINSLQLSFRRLRVPEQLQVDLMSLSMIPEGLLSFLVVAVYRKKGKLHV